MAWTYVAPVIGIRVRDGAVPSGFQSLIWRPQARRRLRTVGQTHLSRRQVGTTSKDGRERPKRRPESTQTRQGSVGLTCDAQYALSKVKRAQSCGHVRLSSLSRNVTEDGVDLLLGLSRVLVCTMRLLVSLRTSR